MSTVATPTQQDLGVVEAGQGRAWQVAPDPRREEVGARGHKVAVITVGMASGDN